MDLWIALAGTSTPRWWLTTAVVGGGAFLALISLAIACSMRARALPNDSKESLAARRHGSNLRFAALPTALLTGLAVALAFGLATEARDAQYEALVARHLHDELGMTPQTPVNYSRQGGQASALVTLDDGSSAYVKVSWLDCDTYANDPENLPVDVEPVTVTVASHS